jgi:cobalt-precorrin 5A hydrolase
MDETGRYVIPLLSGHLGGANALAGELAAVTGGEAVITTATDLHGVFAVDLWAKRQNMTVRQPERIKTVSAKLLAGRMILLDCRWQIRGEVPENIRVLPQTAGIPEKASRDGLPSEADVSVDYYDTPSAALQLVPHILHLGIGCRKGTSAEALEAGLDHFCRERSILPEAIRSAASIDLKSGEEGLLRFCGKHGWPIRFYTAEELSRAEGNFSGSDFVRSVAGVDNVCERAAVLKSGGKLRETKYAQDGVTFALAEEEASFDWSW